MSAGPSRHDHAAVVTIPNRATRERVLVVADWSLDLDAVVAELVRRASGRHVAWSLLMPAWLHGLDWAGDPYVSHPCAETALLTLRELAVAAGLDVELALVGDHEPLTAVGDACAAVAWDAILLCTRHRRFRPATRSISPTGCRR